MSDLVGTADSPIALVVDDDKSVAGLLAKTLRRRGFSVSEAYDGAEALAAIEAHRPDIMLLDLKMPKMDGYQVIKAVKSNPELADIPIVVMTAYPIDRSRIDILEMTAAHISKPLSPEDIAKRVDELFEARAKVGDAVVKRVLAVDDEPHILKLVAFSLRSGGFEVLEASDGLAAIEIARAEQPDLILMDVMMPALDGFEACRRLKADPATADIPVVMLSAKSQKTEQAAGLDSGATEYICKPFTPKELVAAVRGYLGE